MVNDIVNGISVRLNDAFGDKYKIYDSTVKQGFEEPCFLIKLLTMLNNPYIGKRVKRTYPFEIHYFPEDETDNEGMVEVGDKLIEKMEYITLLNGDILRGRDMSYQIVDGVLHFAVTYSVVVNDLSREEPMDEAKVRVDSL